VSMRGSLGVGALIIIAAGTWYISRSLQTDDEPVQRGDTFQNGYYVKAARILGTNTDGQLMYEIEAEYAEQQDDNEVELQNVEINYTTEANVPWTLNADTALIGNDRDFVVLSGHVVAISEEGFSGHVTEIRTPYLELEPDSFRATTEERVQIRIGARSLTATGMLALLRTNQLQLQADVSGKFAP